MKNKKIDKICWLIILILIFIFFCSCKTKARYVPVEAIKKEYMDRWHRDSVYIKDSVIVVKNGDTVYKDKYIYMYRDRLVRDSIIITDSIQVPYPVIEYKEVNKLKWYQETLMWIGFILSILVIVFITYKIKK